MFEREALIDQARLLISRIERISVDSIWARRSSGLRGALLRFLEQSDQDHTSDTATSSDERLRELEGLIKTDFEFLEKAARERFP